VYVVVSKIIIMELHNTASGVTVTTSEPLTASCHFKGPLNASKAKLKLTMASTKVTQSATSSDWSHKDWSSASVLPESPAFIRSVSF